MSKISKLWNNRFPKEIEVKKESIECLSLNLNQSGLKLQEHIITTCMFGTLNMDYVGIVIFIFRIKYVVMESFYLILIISMTLQ